MLLTLQGVVRIAVREAHTPFCTAKVSCCLHFPTLLPDSTQMAVVSNAAIKTSLSLG